MESAAITPARLGVNRRNNAITIELATMLSHIPATANPNNDKISRLKKRPVVRIAVSIASNPKNSREMTAVAPAGITNKNISKTICSPTFRNSVKAVGDEISVHLLCLPRG